MTTSGTGRWCKTPFRSRRHHLSTGPWVRWAVYPGGLVREVPSGPGVGGAEFSYQVDSILPKVSEERKTTTIVVQRLKTK